MQLLRATGSFLDAYDEFNSRDSVPSPADSDGNSADYINIDLSLLANTTLL